MWNRNDYTEENEPRRETMSAGVIAEFHQRLAAVEASQASIHEKIDAATKAGTLDPALLAKTAHVMTKFFPHDDPPVEVSPPPVARFDQYTGAPLN